MPELQQRDKAFLPALAVVLFFISRSLGIFVAELANALPQAGLVYSGSWPSVALLHYAGMFMAASIPALLKPGTGQRGWRIFPAMLPLALAAALMISHYLALGGSSQAVHIHIRAICMGAFWPLALFVFFAKGASPYWAAVLGVGFAVGEFAWVFLLPAMKSLPALEDGLFMVNALHKLQATLQMALGLVLSACLLGLCRPPQTGDPTVPGVGPIPPVFRAKRVHRPLALAFLGALIFYLVSGLALGTVTPRLSLLPQTSVDLPLLYILLLPAAGLLLDARPDNMRPLLLGVAGALFAVPVLLMVDILYAREVLRGILYLSWDILFLALLTISLRLAGASTHPGVMVALLGALAYAIQNSALIGVGLLEELPPVAGGLLLPILTFLLALLFLLSILLLRQPAPSRGRPPKSATERAACFTAPHLDPFRAAFGLSPRETQVLAGVLRQEKLEDIAKSLGITPSAVKYHLHGLLRKTRTINRRNLLNVYADWLQKTPQLETPTESQRPEPDKKPSRTR